MKLLFKNKFVDYESNKIFNNHGKISLKTGDEINFMPDIEYIVPGFIDQHIHGLLNYDTMDNTIESFKKQSIGLLKEGTTSFFPTTMTADINKINSVLNTMKDAQKIVEGAHIIGAHIEGPFINKEKIGAQNPNHLQTLTKDTFSKLNNLNLIKILSYAPELDTDFELTKFLKANNIVASVGHSNATLKQVFEAKKHGLNCYTHLHNASSGYNHRNPGVVNAAYMEKLKINNLKYIKIYIREIK